MASKWPLDVDADYLAGIEAPDDPDVVRQILAFIEPYKEDATTRGEYEKPISVACLAWNLALMPEAERRRALEEAAATRLKASGCQARRDFLSIVGEPIARKERFFPGNRRYVLHYEGTETKDDFHLSVLSTP